MIRRIAITLAAVAAAGFVAAAPASAHGTNDWDAQAGGHSGIEAGWASGEYQNLGGPYGITTIKGQAAYLDAERGWIVR
ncbi:hypothetical protein [Streptomyces sp. MW-W600-10]|uniref:hypothetical protein n=1 Tax=Streptomyces sp. MW-W600-10 TaxID=2829819 RepID=UPI001C469FEB|nr:hypothetical protein [Streptomyces sp. MW-W600-10]MBV7249202.1 hypothetical protein [Streptomyces sp. MW-W600-10]